MTFRRGTDRTSNPVFKALADSSRREILRLLVRDAPVTERELGAHLAAVIRHSTRRGAAAERDTARIDLVHTHLPRLADVSLITWDRDEAIVDTAPHLAFDDPRFRLLLDAEVDCMDDALSNLAVERRRVLLTVLKDARTSMTRRDLARELLRSDEIDLELDPDAVDDVIASLYHVHLPALDDAGFVEYDREAGRATYSSHPALEEVFTIIYEPDERLVDSYGSFFSGLEAAYKEWRSGTSTKAEWPHSWGDPSHE